MSEVKDDEEMVDQSSSSDSSDDERLIEAEVEVEEEEEDEQDSPRAEENENLVENGEDLVVAEAGEEDKGFESDGTAQLSGKTEEGSAEPVREANNNDNGAGAANAADVVADGGDEDMTENADDMAPLVQPGDATTGEDVPSGVKEEEERDLELKDNDDDGEEAKMIPEHEENGVQEEALLKQDVPEEGYPGLADGPSQSFYFEQDVTEGDESGSEDDQAAFMKELENFFKERNVEFKPPKFYGEGLNCLKLWRGVTRLGGYDRVTACKLWRQVGESFKPPKTCTTVSWSFRIFYEKALLDYERHKLHGGELQLAVSPTEPMSAETPLGGQSAVSGRARRDAAARAMQGWHSQRLLGNGEVGDPIIKDKSSVSLQKREKPLKSVGLLKRKKPTSLERPVKAPRTITKVAKPQVDTMVLDVGPPADWVKINVRKTKDCFEVYALVPGLLREEVRVQSDPAGRLVISGDPEQPDNPWGVTPFKKVISLPSRIDPHQTSAVVTLHGQLFVRVPFEQSDL
ncbi:hypothetical protein Sjap_017611 [Stephania japonica]|uniref:AT-rich interactive domain-containing protein 3 n=1 Tax=Stephania japonica TaxID=461633 RepID=A0AAP0I6H0_9MAGN